MNNQSYYNEQPRTRTDSPRGQSSYGGGYSSYEPPRDDTYRHDMTVAQYDDDRSRYSERRRKSRDGRSRDRSYYDDRRTEYSDDRDYDRDDNRARSSSRKRSSSRSGEKHEGVKELGALAAGGAIGGFAAHKLWKKNGLVTTLGTLAGAWAGIELEKRHERRNSQKREEAVSFAGGRRSSSRPRNDDYDNAYGEDRRYSEHRHERY